MKSNTLISSFVFSPFCIVSKKIIFVYTKVADILIFLKLTYSWFIMCKFLLYSKVIELHAYILFFNIFYYGLS